MKGGSIMSLRKLDENGVDLELLYKMWKPGIENKRCDHTTVEILDAWNRLAMCNICMIEENLHLQAEVDRLERELKRNRRLPDGEMGGNENPHEQD